MLTKVRKWGNSLALRLPKSFATDAQIENDSIVEVSLVNGNIVIKPIKTPKWILDQLLAGVKEENLHSEIDMGDPVGHEVW